MTTTKKDLIERNRALTSKLISLKTAHGKVQRTGFSIQTGSPGCGLTKEEISVRCAALRAEMETVRAEQATVRAQIEAFKPSK